MAVVDSAAEKNLPGKNAIYGQPPFSIKLAGGRGLGEKGGCRVGIIIFWLAAIEQGRSGQLLGI